MGTPPQPYAARLEIDYPQKLDRLSTLLRVIWIIPIAVILSLLTAAPTETFATATGGNVKPVIDRTFPLSETAQAMAHVGEGHARGKTAITMPALSADAGAAS